MENLGQTIAIALMLILSITGVVMVGQSEREGAGLILLVICGTVFFLVLGVNLSI